MTRTASTTSVAAAALLGAAGVVVSVVIGGSHDSADVVNAVAVGVVDLVYIAVAVLICLVKRGHPVGRLALLGAATWGVGEGALALAVQGVLEAGATPALRWLAVFGGQARGLGWILLVVVLPLVFPDGVLAGSPRRQRWSIAVAAGTGIAFVCASILEPRQIDYRLVGISSPAGAPPNLTLLPDLLAAATVVFGVLTLFTAVAGLVGRWRGGDALMRQQLLWLTVAFAVPLAILPVIATVGAAPWAFGLVTLPVPVAIGVAMLQHRLYDVQLAVSRTLTWVGLSAAVAALYAATIGGAGAVLRSGGDTWLPWAAAAVIAVSFAPLRNTLQAGVNRLVYGRWSQPVDVLAATGRRLADAADIPALIRTLAAELGAGLGLRHVEIRDRDDRTLATYGAPDDRCETVQLNAYGEVVGSLRWNGPTLRERDRRLLDDVARQLGGIVHSSRLVDELRAAQERLVLATADDRRRLRRDLHDGLGPALAGLGLQVDTVRNVLAKGGPDLDAHLLRLRSGIQATVLDVRRVVEGLRPPALDELGLVGAVDELVQRLTGHTMLVIEMNSSPRLPRLAAAVEVAAYRVAQEALTNTVRHSRATTCSVDVGATNGELSVRVQDNGTGLAQPRPGGLGLASMHERASEIGGILLLCATPGSGTTVTLRLPIGQPTVRS